MLSVFRNRFVAGFLSLALAMCSLCVLASGSEKAILGTGFAFNALDYDRPATIEYLYHNANLGLLEAGDVILEYRGIAVGSGADLLEILAELPDLEPGEPMHMLVLKDGREEPVVVELETVEILAAGQTVAFRAVEFPDRECEEVTDENGKVTNCLCSKIVIGSSCIRIIHVTSEVPLGLERVVVITSTYVTCTDGTNKCSNKGSRDSGFIGK